MHSRLKRHRYLLYAIPINSYKWIKIAFRIEKDSFETFTYPYFWKSESILIHFNPFSFAGTRLTVVHRSSWCVQCVYIHGRYRGEQEAHSHRRAAGGGEGNLNAWRGEREVKWERKRERRSETETDGVSENRAAISRVLCVAIARLALTGRGSGTVSSMMPAILLRRRSPVLQQHYTRTRTRSLPTAANPLRIIMWPYGGHICLLSTARLVNPRSTATAVTPLAARLGLARPLARLGLWLVAMPSLVRSSLRAADVTRQVVCTRARTRHVSGPSRIVRAPVTWSPRAYLSRRSRLFSICQCSFSDAPEFSYQFLQKRFILFKII